MSILQYKYKAHRLVNTLFYVIVFGIGFLLGFTSNKIDFNKLISQVLMIDNVSAYDFENKYHSQDNLEDHIYNSFTAAFEDFNIEEYNNILCNITADSKDWFYYTCIALNDTSRNNLAYSPFSSAGISYYIGTNNNPVSYYQVQYSFVNSGEKVNEINEFGTSYNENITSSHLPTFNAIYVNEKVSYGNYTYSNFDINHEDFDDFNSSINVLDFEGSNLTFNENLFKDNPDFKEVCVEEGKSFAITSTEMSDINSVYDFDYIWFPYNLNGLSKILYDNSVDTNEIHYTEEEAKERYFFNTKENIDNYFASDIPGLELEVKGYTDKYSYYGWSAWPFRVYYSESYNQFNIFELKEPTKIYIGNLGEDGSAHGGGGTRLEFDEEIEKNEYCFYIKKQYEVTSVNVDEFNDYYGTVPTPNGDLDFSTSFIKDNIEASGLMSQVNTFISKIKDTLDFIGDYIYEFYLSMPLLLRMFLISILVILIVKFIIGMVVR